MGVDFVREQSGKPWKKRWDKGLDRLKSPGLFDVQFLNQQCTVTADINADASLNIGDQLVLQCDGASTVVCNGHQLVGKISGMPAQIQTNISNSGGVALGTVERIGLFGTNAELSIR